MPVPNSISGAREALQHTYQGPTASGIGTAGFDHRQTIQGLNKAAGFNQPPSYRPLARALTPNPRPLVNTPQGQQAARAAANAMTRAASSAPVRAVTPAAKAASRFAQTAGGSSALGAALTLGVGLADSSTSVGQDFSTAGGVGIGTYVGGAAGATLGPAGAVIGSWVGGALGGYLGAKLGQSLFPQRSGPQGDYVGAADQGFTGGQTPGISYSVSFDFYRNGNQVGNRFTVYGVGPISKTSGDRGDGGQFDSFIDGQGRDLWTSGSPEGISQNVTNVQVNRLDGQPDTSGTPPLAPAPSTGPSPYTQPRTQPVGDQPQSWPNFVIPALAGAGIAGLGAATNPSTTPKGRFGPGPSGAPVGAKPNGAPTGNTKPKGAGAPSPNTNTRGGAGSANGGSQRTKPANNCGCNKGILNGMKNLLTGNVGQGAQLGLLGKIDATTTATNVTTTSNAVQLGAIATKLQTMQAFAEKAWQNTHVDKLINLLTLTTVIHNGAMISRDIGETLGYVVSNALAVVGVKDENGNSLDINGLVGSSVANFIKSVVGEDVYNDVRTSWLKANRVVQTATSIVWTIRSINDTTQDVMEWTAENTGKIGNALKKWGIVGERAYPWMSERVKAQDFYRRKFSRVFDGLETAENTASSLSIVTSDVREIQEEINELGEARTRFTDAVSAFGPEDTPGLSPDNQLPTSSPENQPIAGAEEAAETASQSPDLALATDGQRGDP